MPVLSREFSPHSQEVCCEYDLRGNSVLFICSFYIRISSVVLTVLRDIADNKVTIINIVLDCITGCFCAHLDFLVYVFG